MLCLLPDYRLVVICSKEDEDKSHIISRLHTFRRSVVPSLDENECRKYLKAHFTLPTKSDIIPAVLHRECSAAVVDPDKLATFSCNSRSGVSNPRSGDVKISCISMHLQITCKSGVFHSIWNGEVSLHQEEG